LYQINKTFIEEETSFLKISTSLHNRLATERHLVEYQQQQQQQHQQQQQQQQQL
jgi:hypothetical protein